MILDTRLKLANNLDVVAGRTVACTKQSDLFPVLSLGEIGRGEQLYLCVTIRETFQFPDGAGADSVFIKMSLREELFAYTGLIDGFWNTVSPAHARLAHNKNPFLASSGYIELAPRIAIPPVGNDSANNNFVAGKKFLFAINPYAAKIKSTSFDGSITALAEFQGGTYVYFLLEEFTCAIGLVPESEFTPATVITSGKIDVDIVSLAASGAGTNFSDVHNYPTRTIVR